MSDLASEQWSRFSHNVKLWHGYWTRWEPNKALDPKIAFRSVRHFKFLNEEKTKVWHQNTWIYEDGKTEHRGPWDLTKETSFESNRGFVHPVTASVAKGFFNKNGSFINTALEYVTGKVFGVEFGLIRSPLRCSIVCLYSDKGDLTLTAIREDERGLEPSVYWTSDNHLKETSNLPTSKRFVGVEQVVTAIMEDKNDLTGQQWEGAAWEKPAENEIHVFLPDGIAVKCPKDVTKLSGAGFTFTACWLNRDGGHEEIREQTAYFEDGKYLHMKLGIYQAQEV